MPFDILPQITLIGPALSEPFVRYELEKELTKRKLLPRANGNEGEALQASWAAYQRNLRELGSHGGALRVHNYLLDPLLTRLGYSHWADAPTITTREGPESGGRLLVAASGAHLRTWATDFDADLDAPARRGRAYRFSYLRSAQRVLLATGERLGLLTNGVELRLLLSDPARPDSQLIIPIDPYWKRAREVPDTYRLLLALATPDGVTALPELVEKARQQQTRVTKDLRLQARRAVQRFLQEVLDHPANRATLDTITDQTALARALWREGLILVYRLLFIFKLESSDDPAKAFSFASTSLWRKSLSPSVALAPIARAVLDAGHETGSLLEDGFRILFRMFAEGLQSTELHVKPLGGALFAPHTTPWLSQLRWGERAVSHLLDQLLWTGHTRTSAPRERIHYGALDVEDLGRVYEALLELEPGITTAPMCRLRRNKLEVVVPLAQGEPYRPAGLDLAADVADAITDAEDGDEIPGDDEENESAGRKASKVEWIEAIPPHRFYLRVGLGRKASGSFYTPDSFVRFLVQETLGPLVDERTSHDDPQPAAILRLKVLDDAMGSGHFLVEVARFLGEKLYEACRLCDELALATEQRAERAKTDSERTAALAQADAYRQRVAELPDHDDELVKYLPSRAPEGEAAGLSQAKALALCKRLVAVHCLYGVDKNPLAVELAKLALWLECHAEGMPLTFLDHRLVVGDALTGPFFPHLLTYPSNQASLEGLYSQGLSRRFTALLADALRHVCDLEAGVGVSLAELTAKNAAKSRLDRALAPLRIVAAAWAGGVMLGKAVCDDLAYKWLVETVAATGDLPLTLASYPALCAMIARGLGVDEVPVMGDELLDLLFSGDCIPALPFELVFPEVFFPEGDVTTRRGFHVILGNPPWEGIDTSNKEFFAGVDISILDLRTDKQINALIDRLMLNQVVCGQREKYEQEIQSLKNCSRIYFEYVNQSSSGASGATPDLYQSFSERSTQLLTPGGIVGLVLPSSFHANEGATGMRQLFLHHMRLSICYSFENRNKLFEIDTRYKYAVVVAIAGDITKDFRCAFYLHDDRWLFADARNPEPLTYSLNFIKSTTGEQLNFLELQRPTDVEPTMVAYRSSMTSFGTLRKKLHITPTEELHKTKERGRFLPTNQILSNNEDPRYGLARLQTFRKGCFPLVEGKTLHQFTDLWEGRPEFLVPICKMVGKESRLQAASTYRLALRMVASSTNERTSIFAILPPNVLCSNSVSVESQPLFRKTADALALCAFANTYVFDWLLRQMVASNVRFAYLDTVPVPNLETIWAALTHSSLRLTCNHADYAALWQEQLGDIWREPKSLFTWPVLASDTDRWLVRATIDVITAQAYGLNRDQYAHVLSTFSHTSYPQAPKLCLARFDELTTMGLEAFTQKYDPYWDIPLNESLPQPVIDLPLPNVETRDRSLQQLSLGVDLAQQTPAYDQPMRQLNIGV